MITLGIETSCDETAICLVKDKKILAEVISSSMKRHKEFGGIVPEVASRYHLETILPCIKQAFKKARLSPSRVDLIAATGGPGLLGSLLVGVSCAKSLSLAWDKPLVFVDHVLAHAFSAQIANPKPKFPFMGLVVSGGHTLLIHWRSLKSIQIIGSTHDDAAGEAFDKVAKMLHLGYPGGPEIDRISRKGDKERFKFPRPRMDKNDFDFSFSGLKTAVYYKVLKMKQKKKLLRSDVRDLAAGFQEAVCDVLVAKTMRACEQYKVKTLVVGGGVSANQRLRKCFGQAVKTNGVQVVFPDMHLCVDNAVMIAFLAQSLAKGNLAQLKTQKAKRKALSYEVYSEFMIPRHSRRKTIPTQIRLKI